MCHLCRRAWWAMHDKGLRAVRFCRYCEKETQFLRYDLSPMPTEWLMKYRLRVSHEGRLIVPYGLTQ